MELEKIAKFHILDLHNESHQLGPSSLGEDRETDLFPPGHKWLTVNAKSVLISHRDLGGVVRGTERQDLNVTACE